MNARTSWSLRGEREDAPERADPWDADFDAIGELSEARFDDSGRLRVVPAGGVRGRVAERLREPDGDVSPHALERAVERLARDIEGWQQDGARAASQRRPETDMPALQRPAQAELSPPRAAPSARSDLGPSLDRLMARLDALDEKLAPRSGSERPRAAPDYPRSRSETYPPSRSAPAEPARERSRHGAGEAMSTAAVRPGRDGVRRDRPSEDPLPGGDDMAAALTELRAQLAALQERSAPPRAADERPGGFRNASVPGGFAGRASGRAAARQSEVEQAPGAPSAEEIAAAELRQRVEEIRDQLRRLPSQEQMGRLEGHLLQLAERVDAISEQSGESRALERVETQLASLATQIGELRRVRTGAAAELEQRLAQIAARLDTVAGPPLPVDLGAVEDRIAEIGTRLEQVLSHATGPSLARIEKQLAALARVVDLQEQQGAARLQAALEEKLGAVADVMRRDDGAGALAAIEHRIAALQAMIARRESATAAPQLEQIERKLDELQSRIAASGDGDDRLARHFGPIIQQIAALSRRLDESRPAVDLAPIAQRLERLEASLDERLAALGGSLQPADDTADEVDRAALRADIAALRRELRVVPVRDEDGVPALLQTVANRLDRILREPPATARELEQQVSRVIDALRGLDPQQSALAEMDDRLRDIQERLESAPALAATETRLPPHENDIVAELARALKSDLGALKGAAESSERHTRESLEAVHETLEAVMKRMAFLEKDAPGDAPSTGETAAARPPDRQPTAQAMSREVPEISLNGRGGHERSTASQVPLEPNPADETPRSGAAGLLGRLTSSQLLRRATGGRTESFSPIPEEADDGDDLPLEPGTNAPLDSALRGAPSSDTALMTGAARAAHAPALHAPPAVDLNQAPDVVRSGSDGRRRPAAGDEFLVAARRAAQAAAAEAAEAERSAGVGGRSRLGRLLATTKARRRMVLAGLLALAVAVAALQFARMSDKGEAQRTAAPVVEGPSVAATALGPTQTAQAPHPAGGAPAGSAAVPGESDKAADAAEAEVGDAPSAASGAARPSPSADPLPPPAIGPESLRRAAAGGDAAAQFEIASRYAEGRGVAQDLTVAADWYRRAAENGLAPAQYRLGSIYEKGLGVPKDFAAAQQWYRRAAEAGNVKAMHNLAVLHAEGAGGEPDLEAAAKLFRRAADHGVRDSQFNLAILHARGLGVPQDMIEAYKWFAVAARSGDPESEKRREVIAAALGASDLAKAKAAADAFQPLPVDGAANLVAEPDGGWGPPPQKTSLGAEADLVARAQALLAEVGFDPGPADGTIGPRTREAVSAFQKEAGLPITGHIDTGLITALQSRSG